MSYFKDFSKYIASHDYPSFLKVWEEYCSGDELDAEEVIKILKASKNASFSEFFGRNVERILPLWKTIKDPQQAHKVFTLIIDLISSQNAETGQIVFDYLEKRYGNDEHFNEKIRLIGLRNKDKFQGAISNYELLSHISKGKFVFHTAGWGVGVIVDFSLIREQLTLEFDYVAGKKDLSFATAFKTLIPIPDDHFLAQRFGNPDELEKSAKNAPVEVVRILLRDLGPKTAGEIKDELCELVIPADEWTKWWQNARAKIKKDTMIETPSNLKSPFRLQDTEVTHEEKLQKALESKPDANTLIQMIYSFMKDFPETLKNAKFKEEISVKLNEVLEYEEVSETQKLQIYFFMQDLGGQKKTELADNLLININSAELVMNLLEQIQVLSFKKRILTDLRRILLNWKELFLGIFLPLDQGTLRDYVLTELLSEKEESSLTKKLEYLCAHPVNHPDTFVWYFQKVMSKKKLPFSDKQGKIRFFESFLILLSAIEQKTEDRDLLKKMHSIISDGRYAIPREIMQEAQLDEVKEFLLLATKCHSLSDHDIKILHSLAEVAHPLLAKTKKKTYNSSSEESPVIWTTEQGHLKLQKRIQQIATIETIENAKEIETARAHGDLRENAEFKAALEKRDRLQGELKLLSNQMSQARVITSQDISTDVVGIGAVVKCKNTQGKEVSYTLLGPWDADPDNNILASQSKLAQTMYGNSVGDTFQFQGDTFTITSISSYL